LNKNIEPHSKKLRGKRFDTRRRKLKIIGFANVTIHNILTEEIYILLPSYLKKLSDPKNDNEIIANKWTKIIHYQTNARIKKGKEVGQ